jgi:REP element-mobilizing transposase RayT
MSCSPLAASRIRTPGAIRMNPIVIAYHLVWMGYGWWLPNDPRGSMSTYVKQDVLKELGQLHYGRKLLQPRSWEIRAYLQRSEALLAFPRLTFGNAEVNCIARAFASAIERFKYTCYACAIMPDHIHILIRKHKHKFEEMVRNLQRESHLLLRDKGFVDMEHPIWGGHGWGVFLDHPDDIWRTIPYIEQNPVKIGLPEQQYNFVKPYDNWPLHEGHNPNSPYVKRMRK